MTQRPLLCWSTRRFPRLFEDRRLDQPIRVWVPGCSTGEEAYSIGMLIRDQMSEILEEYDIQIFATDIDAQAIETARRGVYPDSIAADITPERLQRYFVKEGNNYQVTSQIREMVVFAIQSIIKDPPFSKMEFDQLPQPTDLPESCIAEKSVTPV